MAKHYDFGKEAEEIARIFLIENNYEILTKNYYAQKAEIDIIAKENNVLIICEVKARSNTFFSEPEMAVTKSKQKRMILAANDYIEKNQLDMEVRFDILALTKINNQWNIKHLPDAFNTLENEL